MLKQALKVTQHRIWPIGLGEHPVDVIGAGQVKQVLRDTGAPVTQEVFCFCAEQLGDVGHRFYGRCKQC